MIIIGFSGPANSGKDTAAEFIGRVEHQAFFTAFADPLKRAICEMFYLDRDAFIDRESKERSDPELGKSPRQLAQIIGTEIVRAIHPNAWVISMDRRLADIQFAGISILLITDVRFENEADWVREKGGTVIHILRPIARWQHDGHESERGIEVKTSDFAIMNSSTLEEFEDKVLGVYASIKGHSEAKQ